MPKAFSLMPAYQDAPDAGRLILRDGSTAVLRVANRGDLEELGRFFHRLSPESRWQRFLSPAEPDRKLIETMCDSSDRKKQLSLVVLRNIPEEGERIIAVASYWALDETTAEVAFAVQDQFQGKGIGTLLLERLAVLAAAQGFRRFWALTHVQNRPMLDIFRNSGFRLNEIQSGECMEVDFSVKPTEAFAAHSEMLDRVFTAASIRPLFCPSSVAIIGASRKENSIGRRVYEAIRNRFHGSVYAVNPHAESIDSNPCYRSVLDIPERIDLAVIVVPRDFVLEVVEQCGQKGVRGLVVISAGFSETGPDGKLLQEKILTTARAYGMRMVGPNCMGLINTDPDIELNASFSPVYPPTGHVAMSSQSGALGLAILQFARQRHLGLSTFISVGNKADVSGNDLLNYWEQDPFTNVILLYLESFGNPRRFSRIARRVSKTKPIVAIKSGRTPAGSRAAGSHTAALASSDVVVNALFQQTGVVRVDTLEEMFDVASLLEMQPLPAGNRVAIITNAGGPGILCTDVCEAHGLKVPELSEALKQQMRKFLPAEASVANPIDLIASCTPEQYQKTIEVLMESDEIDSLVLIFIPVVGTTLEPFTSAMETGIATGRQKERVSKTILVCLMTEKFPNPPLLVGKEEVPTYAFPEPAAIALSKAVHYADWKSRPVGRYLEFPDADMETVKKICRKTLQQRGEGWLTAEETREVLSAVKLPLPAGGIASTPEEAVRIAREAGYPVALKVASHKIVHKTEVGGVILNVEGDEQVRNSFERIEKAVGKENMDGVIIQPMISNGVEVMVGVTHDPSFGPLIAFGLGGIHVEILGDVCFRITPLTDRNAEAMVKQIKGYKLLQGHRGHPAADIQAIQEVLLQVSQLVEEVQEISEMDLNPIFVFPPGKGCVIADARIKVTAV